MISRQERKSLQKLGGLRTTRLRMAEINVVKAVNAVAEAVDLVEQARQQVIDTAQFCNAEQARLKGELSQAMRAGKDGIDQWKRERLRLRERYTSSQQHLENARELQRDRERELDDCRARQREATMAVEKLNILVATIGRPSTGKD